MPKHLHSLHYPAILSEFLNEFHHQIKNFNPISSNSSPQFQSKTILKTNQFPNSTSSSIHPKPGPILY